MQVSEEKNKKVIALGKAKQIELENKEAALSKELTSRKKEIASVADKEGKTLDQRKAELATLQQSIRDLQDEERTTEGELAQLNSQRDSLQAELRAVEDKAAETLKWKMKAAHQVVKEKEAHLTLEKMKSLKRERIIQVLEGKLREYHDSLKRLDRALGRAEKKKSALSTSIDDRKAKVKAEKEQLAEKQKQGEKLDEEQKTALEQLQAEEAALDQETGPLADASAKQKKEAAVVSVEQQKVAQDAAEIGRLT